MTDRDAAFAYLGRLDAESLGAVVDATRQAETFGDGWLSRRPDGTLTARNSLNVVVAEAGIDLAFDRALESSFPAIAWREPLGVQAPGASGYGCRLCIGTHGLKASDVATSPFVFRRVADHSAHLGRVHPRSDP